MVHFRCYDDDPRRLRPPDVGCTSRAVLLKVQCSAMAVCGHDILLLRLTTHCQPDSNFLHQEDRLCPNTVTVKRVCKVFACRFADLELPLLFTLQASELGCRVPCCLRDSSASCWRSRSVYNSLRSSPAY